ncbi:MAG: hypothetical protein DIU61_004685 [Bacteroidota bacterium]|jgi:hypothetical protein|nr:MAG: hypothetical protein DIU61_01890 [Bacteroidota bacterium]
MKVSVVRNVVFYGLVLYYLVLNYFVFGTIEKYSVEYFLLVIPVAVFVLVFSPYLAIGYSNRTLILGIFMLVTCLISVVRLDHQTFLTCCLLTSTFIVVCNSRVPLNIKVINAFYILALIGCAVSYHAGINTFGYLPELESISGFQLREDKLRISLFPLSPESAFFSLFIIIINYYFNKSISRYFFYAAGGYFMVFSASRTAIAIFAFFACFELTTRVVKFRPRVFYHSLNVIFIFAFVILSNLKEFHILLSESENPIFRAIMLRTEQQITTASDTRDVATRLWIWEQHLRIFSINPLAGVGTYEFGDYVEGVRSKVYHFTTGSESFLTAWLARVGIAALLIVAFVVAAQSRALELRSRFTYTMCLFFFMVMISYGSFVVPYNFMFLLMALSLNFSATDLVESEASPSVQNQ